MSVNEAHAEVLDLDRLHPGLAAERPSGVRRHLDAVWQ
jgi:hypothetical protein